MCGGLKACPTKKGEVIPRPFYSQPGDGLGDCFAIASSRTRGLVLPILADDSPGLHRQFHRGEAEGFAGDVFVRRRRSRT